MGSKLDQTSQEEFHVYRKRDIRKLIYHLLKHPLVKEVEYHIRRIRVIYKFGLSESWYHKQVLGKRRTIIPPRLFSGKKLRLTRKMTYPFDPDAELKKSFLSIKVNRYNKASFFEQRMAMLALAESYINASVLGFPKDMLYDDLSKIRVPDVSGKFMPYFMKRAGNLLVIHFSKFSVDLKSTYKVIRRVLSKGRSATPQKVFKAAVGKIVPVQAYLFVFKYFGLKPGQSIVDPYPSISKVLASVIYGLKYYSDFRNDALVKFLNTEIYAIDPNVIYDFVILDGEFVGESVLPTNLKSKYILRHVNNITDGLRIDTKLGIGGTVVLEDLRCTSDTVV